MNRFIILVIFPKKLRKPRHYLVSLARKNYDKVHDYPSVKNIGNENVKLPFLIDDNSRQEVVDRSKICGYRKRITEDDTAILTIKKAKSNISLPDLESEKENNQALINPTEVSNSFQQKNNSSVKNIENENVKLSFPIDDNSHQEVVDRLTTCDYGKRITENFTATPTTRKAKSNISLPDLESEKENNQALINPTEVSNTSQQKNNSPIPCVDEAKQIKNRSLSSSSSSSCSTCSSCSSSSNSSLSSVDDTSEDPNYSSNSSSPSSSSGSLGESVKQNNEKMFEE
ncbi:hypothetical protein HHI36_024252 [Cryptolaemus montrouzieri]|uniref:Uncharacterized protein n=1 Tax=Cryptolaemus montrouzieri TaxID=559131 RepID=A0ABD2NZ46_9CUCU